jgi:hypothetical protein
VLTHSNPQHVMGLSDNSRNLTRVAGVQTPEFPRRSKRGCYASASRSSVQSATQAFSRRRQICGRGPRWGRWAFARGFTLCGAAGRAADQCSVRSRPAAGTERPCGPAQTGAKPGQTLPYGDEKNYAEGRNHPATPELSIGAGRSPPAPHPQSPGVEPRPFLRPGFLFVRDVHSSLPILPISDSSAAATRNRSGRPWFPARWRSVCGVCACAGPGARTRPSGWHPAPHY